MYRSGPGRDISTGRAEVGTGDVVLVPYGYHGPSMAAPGYDLYYLNVMGGPGGRAWRFCDDPAHGSIRALSPGPRGPAATDDRRGRRPVQIRPPVA